MDSLQQIRQPIEQELLQYTQVFDSFMNHTNPLLDSVLSAVSSRKGKMMRPILTLLSAKLLGEVKQEVYHAASCFEFFHTASLIHDDVVDESDERRGQPSVNKSFGNKVAVLSGDFILSLSLHNAALTGDNRVVEIQSKAAEMLSSGELLQLSNTGSESFSEDVYFDIINAKTAALFRACAEAGAVTAGGTEKQIETLGKFGEIIGLCFQIRDDIFDFSDSANIGKPTGNDMQEGKLTLPVLCVLNTCGTEKMKQIALSVRRHTATADDIASLTKYIIENGGLEIATNRMIELATKAKDLLKIFPENAVRKSLEVYADYVVGRNI